MEKRKNTVFLVLLSLEVIFIIWFIFENCFLFTTVSNNWNESNFLEIFLQYDFLLFPRIVSNLLIVTSFYHVDGYAVLIVIVSFFKAFSYLECGYLLFGIVLFYYSFMRPNKNVKIIGSVYLYTLMLFILKIVVAIICLSGALYSMKMNFSAAIDIMRACMILCIIVEFALIAYLAIKSFKYQH